VRPTVNGIGEHLFKADFVVFDEVLVHGIFGGEQRHTGLPTHVYEECPRRPRMVPLYAARVENLRVGHAVSVRCRMCGHVAEISVINIREKLPLYSP
jgi:hypothetical protein